MMHTSTLRVRYAETDAMGVVHHAAYVPWLEVGRVNLLRAAGCPYSDIEARGLLVVLSDLQVRYRSPARFDDEVVIETQLTTLKSRQIAFRYRALLAATATILVEGQTNHIVVLRATMKPTVLPNDLSALLQPWLTTEFFA
ncbi:MAG: thioesterase family protein [Chloroflexales bacterium]|nr:thioesterase family protein [Chloroflexales bacterium]